MENTFVKYPEINGRYRHYKGGVYTVLSLAKHSETDEPMVVYRSEGFGSVFVRPLSMWFDPIDENTVRFELIKSNYLSVNDFAQ